MGGGGGSVKAILYRQQRENAGGSVGWRGGRVALEILFFFLVLPRYNSPGEGKTSILRSVLRIRDVYPGSRILIFTHPGSRTSDPGSRIKKQQ
jgi:hypothetical protein